MEHRRLLPFPGLDIGEEDSIVVALHDDLIFKPDTGNKRGARRIVLHGRLVEVQVPDAVASLNFVDRAGTIFKQAIRLRLDAIKVLAGIATCVVVDLNLETSDHGLPGRITRIEERLGRWYL